MWSDFLIVFFGQYFIFIVFIIFIWIAYRAYKKRKNVAALRPYVGALIASFVAYGVVDIVRLFYHHVRPFIAFTIPHLLTDSAYSFPSAHTAVLFALATATYFFNKKFAYFIFVAGLIVGIARVAGGVHYPSDILGGMIFGIATSGILYWLYTLDLS
jgi:undecaprenyl-diphosphatase